MDFEAPVETDRLVASSKPTNESKSKTSKCLLFWLVLVSLTSFLWAAWATFLVIDIGAGLDMVQDASFQTHIHFTASPDVNRDHYERMAEIGTDGTYECAYAGVLASCQNDDSVIEIWFTPKGPLYKREHQSTDHHRLLLRSFPFGTQQYEF